MGSILGPLSQGLLYAAPGIAQGYGAGRIQAEEMKQRSRQQQALLQQRWLELMLEQQARAGQREYQEKSLALQGRELAQRETPEQRARREEIEFLRETIGKNAFDLQETGQLPQMLRRLGDLTGNVPLGRYVPEQMLTPTQEMMQRVYSEGLRGIMGAPLPREGPRPIQPSTVTGIPRLTMPEETRAQIEERQARTRYYGAMGDAASDREARLSEQFSLQHKLDVSEFLRKSTADERAHLIAQKRLDLERLKAATEQLRAASLGRLDDARTQQILQDVAIASQSLPPGVVQRLKALEPAWKLQTGYAGNTELLSDEASIRMREEYLRLIGLSAGKLQETVNTFQGGGQSVAPQPGGAPPFTPAPAYPQGVPGPPGAGFRRTPPGARGSSPAGSQQFTPQGVATPFGPGTAVVPRGAPTLPPGTGTRIAPLTPSRPTGPRGSLAPPRKPPPPRYGTVPAPKGEKPAIERDLALMQQAKRMSGGGPSATVEAVMRANLGNPKRLKELKEAYRLTFGRDWRPGGK